MRRFLPFAALLGVALVLGCQDVGTGPDGLVPQFKKDKGCPDSGHPSCGKDDKVTEDAAYTVTNSGDITTNPSSIMNGTAAGPKGGTSIDIGNVFDLKSYAYENALVWPHPDGLAAQAHGLLRRGVFGGGWRWRVACSNA